MAKAASNIRARAKLLRPLTPKGASWAFLVLAKSASAKLPTRGMTTVEGTINGYPLLATLEEAVAAAVDAGGEVALPPMDIAGHGTCAIYIHGGAHHGLWQR